MFREELEHSVPQARLKRQSIYETLIVPRSIKMIVACESFVKVKNGSEPCLSKSYRAGADNPSESRKARSIVAWLGMQAIYRCSLEKKTPKSAPVKACNGARKKFDRENI